jgi:hypothetical protein
MSQRISSPGIFKSKNKKNNNNNTFLLRYVSKNVCNLKTPFLLPLAPLKMFINFKEPLILLGAWTILIIFWLILWLAVPCNPNLNCIPFETNSGSNKRKDGTKAFVVSILCIYLVFLCVAIYAKIFVCMDVGTYFKNTFNGGITSQIFSLTPQNLKNFEIQQSKLIKK